MSQIPQFPPAPRKGLHPMAWVGIGCGSLVLVGVIGAVALGGFLFKKVKDAVKNPSKASAEMIVAANKDLEKISSDESTGEMTVRVKSSGEEVTLKYDDLAQGRFTIKGKDGKVMQFGQGDLSQVPAWVPRYAKATNETLVVHAIENGQTTGVINFQTHDALSAVKEFYKQSSVGAAVSSSSDSSYEVNSEQTLALHFTGDGREITVNAYGKSGGPLSVTVRYAEKK